MHWEYFPIVMFYLILTVSSCRQIPLFNQLYTTILQEAPFPLIQKPLQLSDLCVSAGASLEEPSLQLSSCFTHGAVCALWELALSLGCQLGLFIILGFLAHTKSTCWNDDQARDTLRRGHLPFLDPGHHRLPILAVPERWGLVLHHLATPGAP